MTERNIPITELDATFMTIDPAWGKEVTEELNEKLTEAGIDAEIVTGEDGKTHIAKKHLWGLLSYYTRDLRMGNIDFTTFIYCQRYLDFAGDCLRGNWPRSFMTALSRVITAIELSQSKGGFLRRRQGTITQEKFDGNANPLEPSKKSIFGGQKAQSRR